MVFGFSKFLDFSFVLGDRFFVCIFSACVHFFRAYYIQLLILQIVCIPVQYVYQRHTKLYVFCLGNFNKTENLIEQYIYIAFLIVTLIVSINHTRLKLQRVKLGNQLYKETSIVHLRNRVCFVQHSLFQKTSSISFDSFHVLEIQTYRINNMQSKTVEAAYQAMCSTTVKLCEH